MTTDTSDALALADEAEEEAEGNFDAGFESVEQTTTPANTQDKQEHQPQDSAQAAADALPAPKLAQITEEQFQALMRKADEVDQIRSDARRQIDTLAGHLGGMKQLVDSLKQRGPMTAGQLKRVSQDYPELAKALQEDLREFGGAGGPAMDMAEVSRRAQAIVAQELPKELVKQEVKILRLYHRDWVDVVRSQEFTDWSRTLSPTDQHRLAGNDGEFIADKISEFKARPRPKTGKQMSVPTNTRQRRLEVAVSPKGAGGHAPASAAEDDFEAGFRAG